MKRFIHRGFLVILCLVSIGPTVVLGLSDSSSKAKEGSIVKASIPRTLYASNRSFYLLVSTSEKKEEFLRLDVVFKFTGLNQQECFERNDKVFRDVMYRLLRNQSPSKNTVKEWNTLIKEKVMGELTSKLGRCKISDIVVESVQRF
ncbi:MAG: hypothetical protein N2260_06100 [Syntrophobacterales bacterium]|nr:hypothetical protein [Syntrophobacterales bacterium]